MRSLSIVKCEWFASILHSDLNLNLFWAIKSSYIDYMRLDLLVVTEEVLQCVAKAFWILHEFSLTLLQCLKSPRLCTYTIQFIQFFFSSFTVVASCLKDRPLPGSVLNISFIQNITNMCYSHSHKICDYIFKESVVLKY